MKRGPASPGHGQRRPHLSRPESPPLSAAQPPAPPPSSSGAHPQPSPDRRARPRLPAGPSLTCRVVVGGQDFPGCGVVDLSGCGVGLTAPNPVPPGAWLCVVLSNRAAPDQYIAIAQVARCAGPDGGLYRVGAHLLNPLSDALVQRLTC